VPSDKWPTIQAIYESEKWFWSLLAAPVQRAGFVVYDAPGNPLREAHKVVIEGAPDEQELEKALASPSMSRLVSAPSSCVSSSGKSVREHLASACGDALLEPNGEACLYMVAPRQRTQVAEPQYEVRPLHPGLTREDAEVIRTLRSSKDVEISDHSVQNALLGWVERRSERIGFTTFALFHNGTACGTLSAVREGGVTRLRDLFVLPGHRGGKADLLIAAAMERFDPPYAVVTDTNNKARKAYRRNHFEAVYVQEAFTVTHP